LAEKYLALWNEPDADRRRRMIAELWTEDARHILQPPQEIRAIAARAGLAMTAILEARGYEEIAARAASAYDHWVRSEGTG
jgi:2-hydroxychromene-2-carboxylate isomerase